jgi:hypothetical protein
VKDNHLAGVATASDLSTFLCSVTIARSRAEDAVRDHVEVEVDSRSINCARC